MKSKKIKINGLKHQFYFWGNPKKPKLFLFHGWLDTAASFEFLCRYLEKDFYCIAPDFRGYGKSEWSKSPLGYFFMEYVADLKEIFEHFSHREPVRILGHSFGGAISSFYAGAFPERVSHFINVEGFAFRDNPPERGPEKARAWLNGLSQVKAFKLFKDRRAFAERLIEINPRLPLERALWMARYQTKPEKTGVRMAADPRHLLAEPYLQSKPLFYKFWESIQAKCLLVYANLTNMNDWVKSPNLEKEMSEWFSHFPSNRQVCKIEGCGHMVHHEKPKELTDAVLKFLL